MRIDKFLNAVNITKRRAISEDMCKSGVVAVNGVVAKPAKELKIGDVITISFLDRKHGLDEHVSSPTFSIMQNYGEIYHYDIYNGGCEGILKNGLFENLFEEGLHLIEWADENLINLLKKYELDFCVVRITPHAQGRKYEVSYA